jgi:hypothetical protein
MVGPIRLADARLVRRLLHLNQRVALANTAFAAVAAVETVERISQIADRMEKLRGEVQALSRLLREDPDGSIGAGEPQGLRSLAISLDAIATVEERSVQRLAALELVPPPAAKALVELAFVSASEVTVAVQELADGCAPDTHKLISRLAERDDCAELVWREAMTLLMSEREVPRWLARREALLRLRECVHVSVIAARSVRP